MSFYLYSDFLFKLATSCNVPAKTEGADHYNFASLFTVHYRLRLSEITGK